MTTRDRERDHGIDRVAALVVVCFLVFAMVRGALPVLFDGDVGGFLLGIAAILLLLFALVISPPRHRS